MEWSDIACIVFVCVTANHLGLVKAVEEKIGFPNKMFLTEMLLCHQGMEFLDVLLLLETVLIDHRRQYTKDVIICSDND